MIIKKPYAFLIKKFRLIHGLLFIMLVYLAVKSVSIFTFFNDYANERYYVNTIDLASTYVNIFMFVVCILAILFGMLIYYILSIKKKNRKIYLFLCLYYIVLFVFFIYIFIVFQNLQYTAMDYQSVRALRDIVLIILLPQIIFLCIVFFRALGFNIRQFDFKKDLEELKVDASDYEKVEVTFGKNNYLISRFFRKTFRLLKYFIFENKFLVTIMASIAVLIISLVVVLNLRVYSVNYRENDQVLANTLWYMATETYLTNTDISGKEINAGKYYVLVKIDATNKSSGEVTLDRDTFRLVVNDESILPKFNLSDKFMDIGETFSPTEITSGTDKQYVVVFEINESDIKKEYVMRIKNFSSKSVGSIQTDYKDIVITPTDIHISKDVSKYTIPAEVSLKDTVLKSTTINVTSYEVAESFKEKYKFCDSSSNCYNGTYVIKPTTVGKGSLAVLKIKSSISVDTSLYMLKYLKGSTDFIGYYGTLRYRAYGVTKTISLSTIPSTYGVNEYAYVEVPSEVIDANKIELILTIRGQKYTIVLK